MDTYEGYACRLAADPKQAPMKRYQPEVLMLSQACQGRSVVSVFRGKQDDVPTSSALKGFQRIDGRLRIGSLKHIQSGGKRRAGSHHPQLLCNPRICL